MTHIEPLGDWLAIAPWKSRLLLLIDVDTMTQAVTIGDKREMLRTGGRIVAIWPGQWSSSARVVVGQEVDWVLDVLG
jgi:hypothetical protein